MKLTILVALISLLSFKLCAQSPYSIKGAVVDTAANARLLNASISILNSKDSTLVKFTRADAEGSFGLTDLKAGKFILLITYPGYADYVDDIKLDSADKARDLGKLNMILKSRILADVIVKGTIAAIKIKGDTTEFNAAAYKIQPNSKVEDLLKQLPGIQVDKDGKITAQGQTVTKVLVDGEEFFGDDPTLVTKNLRGDMVDKVQLFDKKSDQAAFTGIDDGATTKTINIKLKEDKKNGYFGKVDAGGSPDYYQGQAMFNSFKAKQKFSAYGTSANTGKTGLGWEDSNKYGSSGAMQMTDDGGMYFSGGGGDDIDGYDGRYNGRGIPSANTAGLHYETKWNEDKQSLNTNYKIGSLGVDGDNNSQNQSTLPTGIINSNSDQTFNNSTFRQKLDATYQLKIDSTTNLKIVADGTLRSTKTHQDYLTGNFRGDNSKLNNSNRSVSNQGDQYSFNMNALLTKKLKKTGRTLSWNVAGSMNDNNGKGFVNSINTFYNTAEVLDSIRNIDQYKTNAANNRTLSTNLTYTEPLFKTLSLVLNTGLSQNQGVSDRQSFNQSPSGQYEALDAAFSNNFKLDQLTSQAGAIFSYKKNKTVLNFGTKLLAVNFGQTDLYTNKDYSRHFINWSPQASYQYRFSQQKSFRLSYNGSTSQPSINQIQPIRENTDPLNIYIGNPDLKPSFRNSFNVNFNSYKVLSNRSLYLSGSYSFTTNQITNKSSISNGGKNVYQSVNLGSNLPSNYSIYGYYDKKIKGIDLNVGINFNIYKYTSFNYVNTELNTQKTGTYSGGLNISKYKEKKYDFYLSFGPNFNTSRSSLQSRLNNDGAGWNGDASFTVYLPGKVELRADGNYQYKEKTQAFNSDFKRLILNSSLSKKFLEQDNLKFSVSGNDLLNQNIGFNRSGYSSSSYTTIKRYYLLSLTWDFNKMGGAAKTPAK